MNTYVCSKTLQKIKEHGKRKTQSGRKIQLGLQKYYVLFLTHDIGTGHLFYLYSLNL